MKQNRRPTTVEDYIEAAAPIARPHLRELRRILAAVAPEGTEMIKWNVPMFWDGRVLFGYAASKAHITFGPGKAAVSTFADDLSAFKCGKETIQLPYDRDLPEDLIRRIAEYCVSAGS